MDIKAIPASFAGFVPEIQNGVEQSIEELFGAPRPDYHAGDRYSSHTAEHTQRTK